MRRRSLSQNIQELNKKKHPRETREKRRESSCPGFNVCMCGAKKEKKRAAKIATFDLFYLRSLKE